MLTLILFTLSAFSFASPFHHEVIPNVFSKKDKVEFFWKAPEGQGPHPVYIIVHGHQGSLRKGGAIIAHSGALNMIAKSGLIAVSVSQAGYGLTSGKPDHAGVGSQNALISVIRFFGKKKVILYGTSMGATLSAITASREPGIAGIILENGMYDVKAGLDNLRVRALNDSSYSELYQSISEETGSGFLERSALFQAEKIKSKVLIFAGLGDQVALPDQSLSLHEKLKNAGSESEFYLFPFSGHSIPQELKTSAMKAFVNKIQAK